MLDYQPLVGTQIRLLTIEPGIIGDIECTLDTVSLDDRPSFDALSYVWGDPEDTRDIYVDGTAVTVTRSLFTALRRFRRLNQPWTVWADAICINQQDWDERGRQVRLMGRIYSECEVCQVWLGEAQDDPLPEDEFPFEVYQRDSRKTDQTDEEVKSLRHYIDIQGIRSVEPICESNMTEGPLLNVPGAFSILKLLAADKHFYELPFYSITTFPDFELCQKWHHARRSLVNICSRAWWYRTWTVQEAVLPRCAVVNIGHHCINLDFFLKAATNFTKHVSGSCCEHVTGSIWELAVQELSLEEVMIQLLELQKVVAWRRDNAAKNLETDSQRLHLSMSRFRQATDPRDAVYGYLGILPDLLPSGYQPSYQKSVQSLYGYTTKQFIRNQRSLSILEEIRPLNRARTDLRSWTIDWLDNESIVRRQYFQASGQQFDHYTRADLFYDSRALPVEVVPIGTVTQALTFNALGSSAFSPRWGLFVQTLQECRYAAGVPERHSEFNFWRTLYQDRSIHREGDEHKRFRPKVDLAAVERWWTYFQDTPQVFSDSDMIDSRCLTSLTAKIYDSNHQPKVSFCVLDSGRIGILPLGVRVGDLVVVAKGLDYPMALRMMREGDSSDEEDEESDVWGEEPSATARFLGCAYVDGVMYGEAASAKTEWELIHLV